MSILSWTRMSCLLTLPVTTSASGRRGREQNLMFSAALASAVARALVPHYPLIMLVRSVLSTLEAYTSLLLQVAEVFISRRVLVLQIFLSRMTAGMCCWE